MISNTCISEHSLPTDIHVDDSSGTKKEGSPSLKPGNDRPERLIDNDKQYFSVQQHRTAGLSATPIALKEGHSSKANSMARTGFDLIRLAKDKQCAQVKIDIGMDADIEQLDENEMNAIMHAAQNGNLLMVEALIAAGADVNRCNMEDETALMLAASGGHVAIVKLLVKHCDFIDSNDKRGATALTRAARCGDAAIVSLLLEKKAFIDGTDNKGQTAFLVAAYHGHMDIVILLLESGANINAKDKLGMSAFLWAASNGHSHIVRLMIAAGADTEAKSLQGHNAMSLAAFGNRVDVLRDLLARGADAASKRKNVDLALMLAARNGSTDAARLLVEHGANLENQNEAALVKASGYGHHETVKMLLENGAATQTSGSQEKALQIASGMGHIATVEVLLTRGKAAIDANNEHGRTALMLAAMQGHTGIVRLLLKHGATASAEGANGWNALSLAVKVGHIDTVELLLDSLEKTDINRAKRDGITPLMLAARNGHSAIVKLFLDMGADPDAIDDNSETAFMHAANNDKYDTAMLMMNYRGGVDICLAAAAGQNNTALIECIGRVLSSAPNYHPRDARTMIEHIIVDLRLNAGVIVSLVKGGLIPTKSDRKALMEDPEIRQALHVADGYYTRTTALLKRAGRKALSFAEYRAGDHAQVDRLVDAPMASPHNPLGLWNSEVERELGSGHPTGTNGIYRHWIGRLCDTALVRKNGLLEHKMLGVGWRSGITSQLDLARSAATQSFNHIAEVLSSQGKALGLKDLNDRQVDVQDIRLKDTLFAFELARNEPLNQLAYPEKMLPPAMVENRNAASHAQAKALLELNRGYAPLKLNMPALERARQLEAAVKKNRLPREQALVEVEQALLDANAIFFKATDLQSDLAQHWLTSEMGTIISALESIRTSLRPAVLV